MLAVVPKVGFGNAIVAGESSGARWLPKPARRVAAAAASNLCFAVKGGDPPTAALGTREEWDDEILDDRV